jgi:hypothetical protein
MADGELMHDTSMQLLDKEGFLTGASRFRWSRSRSYGGHAHAPTPSMTPLRVRIAP